MISHDTLIMHEQAVIGSLLKNNDLIDRVGDLTEAAFFREDHQILYREILSFVNKGNPIDLIIIAEQLEKSEELDRVGGLEYIGSIVANAPSGKNIKAYADQVMAAFKERKLTALAGDISSSVGKTESIDQIIERAESELMRIAENQSSDDICHIGQAVDEAIEWAQSERSTVKTGLIELDRLITGFEKSNLIIIAGRPSMGKSALAMQIAEHVSKTETVAIFSLEMSKREVGSRIITYHKSHLPESQAMSHVYGLKLHIDDTAAVGLSHIRLQCKKIKRKHGLSMVVIDYLQLMRGQGDNRTQEIGAISRGLKALAKEFDIPVVVLSQLNRKLEDRVDKRPVMSDLRDSGEIEQDADQILFIYRDEVYNKESEFKGLAEIICRKNRNGSIGDVVTAFNGPLTRFENHTGHVPEKKQKIAQKGFSVVKF